MSDSYEAYCLDEAVWTFGRSVEAELDKIDGKNMKQIQRKQTMRLQTLLGERKFADPAAMFKK